MQPGQPGSPASKSRCFFSFRLTGGRLGGCRGPGAWVDAVTTASPLLRYGPGHVAVRGTDSPAGCEATASTMPGRSGKTMMPSPADREGQLIMARSHLDQLLGAITRRGFRLIGPTVREGAIVYDEISSSADLPAGWTDEQDGGRYRLRRRGDDALFGYNVGPQSPKRYLFPPSSLLSRVRSEDGLSFAAAGEPDAAPLAFMGLRSCELHAIAIQDRVFLGGRHADPVYSGRREGAFIVAVNCGQAGGTCFCVSMQTGPRAESGFDLALTEFLDGGRHEFLVEIGTVRGAEVMSEVACRARTGRDPAPA